MPLFIHLGLTLTYIKVQEFTHDEKEVDFSPPGHIVSLALAWLCLR